MMGKIQSITTGLLSKSIVLATKTVYYGKVGAELSKQIYLKERLQPPSIDEFKRAYVGFYQKGIFYASRPKDIISLVQTFNKDHYIKFTAYFVQLLGFYSVGEIIGRRNVVGYKDHSNHH